MNRSFSINKKQSLRILPGDFFRLQFWKFESFFVPFSCCPALKEEDFMLLTCVENIRSPWNNLSNFYLDNLEVKMSEFLLHHRNQECERNFSQCREKRFFRLTYFGAIAKGKNIQSFGGCQVKIVQNRAILTTLGHQDYFF